ncbi:MAG: dimethylsulfoniopropionate lyase [Roseovarius sp.]
MTAQDALRAFVDAARTAYEAQGEDPRGRASCGRIFAALEGPLTLREARPARLPACAHLAQAADPGRFAPGPLRDLVRAFGGLEPHLVWYRRGGDAPGASPGWEEAHANAMIVGPGGLVPEVRVWLGVSLLAPHVRYPDHRHPPEETYLVLSEGEFWQEGRGWFSPGVGGSFYNPPNILHAMRSGEAPLFAFWALWATR